MWWICWDLPDIFNLLSAFIFYFEHSWAIHLKKSNIVHYLTFKDADMTNKKILSVGEQDGAFFWNQIYTKVQQEIRKKVRVKHWSEILKKTS